MLSRAILHSHPERSLLFPCPQTLSVTHTLQNPHSFFSSNVFLKEEPNPVLVETGCYCYYYLQEKQKILIFSKAQHKQWMGRREVETTPQRCHSVQPLQTPKVQVLCPLFVGRETERQGRGTGPGGSKAEPTISSRTRKQHCLCNPGLFQATLPRRGDQHMNESWVFSHKKGKRKNVSHSTVKQFQPHHAHVTEATGDKKRHCAVGCSPAQIQVNRFLRWGRGAAVLLQMFTPSSPEAPKGTCMGTEALLTAENRARATTTALTLPALYHSGLLSGE